MYRSFEKVSHRGCENGNLGVEHAREDGFKKRETGEGRGTRDECRCGSEMRRWMIWKGAKP
jgi:hypothetical protein